MPQLPLSEIDGPVTIDISGPIASGKTRLAVVLTDLLREQGLRVVSIYHSPTTGREKAALAEKIAQAQVIVRDLT